MPVHTWDERLTTVTAERSLRQAGVAEIFTPGASTEQVIAWVKANVKPRQL